MKQINVYCKICKNPLLVTDTSMNPLAIGVILGNSLLQHLREEHKECSKSVEEQCIKAQREIFAEYITPDFEGIAEMFKEELGNENN